MNTETVSIRTPSTFAPTVRAVSTVALGLLLGCSYGEEDAGGGGTVCDDIQGGGWDPSELDWSDVSEPGPDPQFEPPYAVFGIQPHHPYLTAVHNIHLSSGGGELLMFHGYSEERVWPIGSAATQMKWQPYPYTYDNGAGSTVHPDLFCSGHVHLADGSIFLAGGNINGSAGAGGLAHAFRFDPWAEPFEDPFGWEYVDEMAYDRWYPTLTALADGRVLISGGYSRGEDTGDGALETNVLEVLDPTQPAALSISTIPAPFPVEVPGLRMPNYPFMFLLPNGDVLYAGSESAGDSSLRHGRVLVPDYNSNDGVTWAWDPEIIESTVRGGSAAMYAPGRIIKTGGGGNPSTTAEVLDLSGRDSGDYGGSDAFTLAAPMHHARHFHTLTVLPDGRVLATGGNWRGNGASGERFYFPCEGPGGPIVDETCDAGCPSSCVAEQHYEPPYDPTGTSTCSAVSQMTCEEDSDCQSQLGAAATCSGGRCRKECVSDADCPTFNPAPDDCPGNACNPMNNECYATRMAEVWDPECDEWLEVGEQQDPRLYHSTAILLRDGRVLSTGGGHRPPFLREYPTAEYFEPENGSYTVLDQPQFGIPQPVVPLGPEPPPPAYVAWGDELTVTPDDTASPVTSGVLMRLGAVTHGFDMDQRRVVVSVDTVGDDFATFTMPSSMPGTSSASSQAPPGDYMLFLRHGSWAYSGAQYVRLGPPAALTFACPVGSLTANEVSCDAVPVGGMCPAASTHTETFALPQTPAPGGAVDGWPVHVPGGFVATPSAPTADEYELLETMCIEACEAWAQGRPGASVACSAAGAFDPAVRVTTESMPTIDYLSADTRDGSSVLGGASLGCGLDTSCCMEFDEALCQAAPHRVTVADDMLGVGEEYRVALGADSQVTVSTTQGTYELSLSGSIGYSMCTEGSETQPCPFYLGSFEAETTGYVDVIAACDDGTRDRIRVQDLELRLVQPSFGVARAGVDELEKVFPPGALRIESSLSVDTVPHHLVRPNEEPVSIDASGSLFQSTGLTIALTVPCNSGETQLVATVDLFDPGDGSAIGRPPSVALDTPPTVVCGENVTLAAEVDDPDGDLEDVRWLVDGVLLSKTTAQIQVDTAHTLTVIASDARGAATTAEGSISCL